MFLLTDVIQNQHRPCECVKWYVALLDKHGQNQNNKLYLNLSVTFAHRGTHLFLSLGRAEPAGRWQTPAGSESDWSSPQLCRPPAPCPAHHPGRADGRSSDRPSARTAATQKLQTFTKTKRLVFGECQTSCVFLFVLSILERK